MDNNFEKYIAKEENKNIDYFFKKNNLENLENSSEADISLTFEFVDNIRKIAVIRPYCLLFKKPREHYSPISLSFAEIESANGNTINSKLLDLCSNYISHVLKTEKDLKNEEFDGHFPFLKTNATFVKNNIKFL